MFADPPAMLRILHRHVPAIEVHHLGAHRPMDGVQSGFTRSAGFNRGGQSRASQLEFTRIYKRARVTLAVMGNQTKWSSALALHPTALDFAASAVEVVTT